MAKKKKWYEVEAPKPFENKVIAEIPASDPKHLIGRTIEVNLIDLIPDTNKFYMKLYFKITEVDTRCRTEFIGHDYFRERIYRIIQKGIKKISSIEDITTKDGKKIRIKSITIVGGKTPSSIMKKIRADISNTLKEIANKATLNDILNMLISDELERTIKDNCNKIYPTNKVEVYRSEVLL